MVPGVPMSAAVRRLPGLLIGRSALDKQGFGTYSDWTMWLCTSLWVSYQDLSSGVILPESKWLLLILRSLLSVTLCWESHLPACMSGVLGLRRKAQKKEEELKFPSELGTSLHEEQVLKQVLQYRSYTYQSVLKSYQMSQNMLGLFTNNCFHFHRNFLLLFRKIFFIPWFSIGGLGLWGRSELLRSLMPELMCIKIEERKHF